MPKITYKKKPKEIVFNRFNEACIWQNKQLTMRDLKAIEYGVLLQRSLNFGDCKLGDETTFFWEVLSRIGEKITSDNLLLALNDAAKLIYKTKSNKKFLVLTSVSLSPNNLPRTISYNGIKVRFLRRGFAKKLKKQRESLISKYKQSIPDTPDDYCKIQIEVADRTIDSAHYRCMRALGIIRAMYCIELNPKQGILHFRHSRSPINFCRLGGYTTAHLLDETNTLEKVYYEPRYFDLSVREFDYVDFTNQRIRKRLKKIEQLPVKLRIEVENVLNIFTEAFDQQDTTTAFLGLWCAIESFIKGSQEPDKLIISRCAGLFKDIELHIQVLTTLRDARNGLAHESEQLVHSRMYCFQLQKYFFALINFTIDNKLNFNSIIELRAFLDICARRDDVKKEYELLSKFSNWS